MNQTLLGHYDENGCAYLKIHLCGVKHEPPGIEYDLLIDTGFSGFIQIPTIRAIELQLPLQGTLTSVLADGSTITSFTVLVEATLDGQNIVGVAVLSQSDIFLVGMEFLRQFRKTLVVSQDVVGLIDDDLDT